MRATEHLSSIKDGIYEEEMYSHIDIRDESVRKGIASARGQVKKDARIVAKEKSGFLWY